MAQLHKMVLEWHCTQALCFTDIILLGENSKIQLLESFPRGKDSSRRAWFAEQCSEDTWRRGLYSERNQVPTSSSMPPLFTETCARRRYFHFVRFSLELCEESLVRTHAEPSSASH